MTLKHMQFHFRCIEDYWSIGCVAVTSVGSSCYLFNSFGDPIESPTNWYGQCVSSEHADAPTTQFPTTETGMKYPLTGITRFIEAFDLDFTTSV